MVKVLILSLLLFSYTVVMDTLVYKEKCFDEIDYIQSNDKEKHVTGASELYKRKRVIVNNDRVMYENFDDSSHIRIDIKMLNLENYITDFKLISNFFVIKKNRNTDSILKYKIKLDKANIVDKATSNIIFDLYIDCYWNRPPTYKNIYQSFDQYKESKEFIYNGFELYSIGMIKINDSFDTHVIVFKTGYDKQNYVDDESCFEYDKLWFLNIKNGTLKSIIEVAKCTNREGDYIFCNTKINDSGIFTTIFDGYSSHNCYVSDNYKMFMKEKKKHPVIYIYVSKYYLDDNGHVQFVE